VARLIAAACVTATALAGCGSPEFTYVKNSDEHVFFKVPYGWHELDQKAVGDYFLGEDPDSETGQRMGQLRPWSVAYDEADEPALEHFWFTSERPFVYARVEYLTMAGRDRVSLDTLRDLMFPVSDSGRETIQQRLAAAEQAGQPQFYPLQDFEPVNDVVLSPGDGMRGVRVVYNYRLASQNPPVTSDVYTFDQTAYLSEDSTRVYLLVITCSAACYRERVAELDTIATSFKVRSP
jgi:hypothetical protein